MQNQFNAASSRTAAAEYLRQHNYNFEERDGALVVQGNIDIARRQMDALPDLSCVIVLGNFYCQDNQLTSLKGAPKEVRGGFWCNNNQLQSLEYSPAGITGQYICSNNRLTSVEHAPAEISGDFSCRGNPLSSLEGAPKKFHKLMCDAGDFTAWEDVPEKLRFSPAHWAERVAAAGRDATVLKDDVRGVNRFSVVKNLN